MYENDNLFKIGRDEDEKGKDWRGKRAIPERRNMYKTQMCKNWGVKHCLFHNDYKEMTTEAEEAVLQCGEPHWLKLRTLNFLMQFSDPQIFI